MLLYGSWLQLPINTRHALAHAFKINKKNPTHVVDNMVRDDGYPIGDVERALNMEAMQEYVGTASTSEELVWAAVVAKAEGREVTISQTVDVSSVVNPDTIVETSPIPTPKRPKRVIKKKSE